MDLKILFGLALYWTLISLVFGLASVDSFGNPLIDEGYSTNVEINATGFSGDEFDTGGILGFFSGVGAIFTAMARIIGFYLFGITDVLTDAPQIIFSAWQTLISIFTIGFIISSFWDG